MDRFDDFIKERRYLLNVSERRLDWYRNCFCAWRRYGGTDQTQWVVNMHEAGVSVVSINTYICGMNAYWKWSGEKTKLRYLKEEQKILATLTKEGLARLVNFKPGASSNKTRSQNLIRAHLVALTILDTGLRASEILGITKENIELDQLSIKGVGQRR
jgi:integrase